MKPTRSRADQSNQTTDPKPEPTPTPTPVRASARALIEALGRVELDDLRTHHLTLAMAVAEMSRAAGRDWPWGPDDPTVALLRAAAKLAIDAPDAPSEHAEILRQALQDHELTSGQSARDGSDHVHENG